MSNNFKNNPFEGADWENLITVSPTDYVVDLWADVNEKWNLSPEEKDQIFYWRLMNVKGAELTKNLGFDESVPFDQYGNRQRNFDFGLLGERYSILNLDRYHLNSSDRALALNQQNKDQAEATKGIFHLDAEQYSEPQFAENSAMWDSMWMNQADSKADGERRNQDSVYDVGLDSMVHPLEKDVRFFRNDKACLQAVRRCDEVLYVAPEKEPKFYGATHIYSFLGNIYHDFIPVTKSRKVLFLNNSFDERISEGLTDYYQNFGCEEFVFIPAKEGGYFSNQQLDWMTLMEDFGFQRKKLGQIMCLRKDWKEQVRDIDDYDLGSVPKMCNGIAFDNKLVGFMPYLIGPKFSHFAKLKGKIFVCHKNNHSFSKCGKYHVEVHPIWMQRPPNDAGKFEPFESNWVLFHPKRLGGLNLK